MMEPMTNLLGVDGLPLAGVRVVELNNDRSAMCSRIFADLGADVVRIRVGVDAAFDADVTTRLGRAHLFQDANKRCVDVTHDDAGIEEARSLIDCADVLIESFPPGWIEGHGLGRDVLWSTNPRLVITSITDFGQTGPYRDWVATDWVHMALNSILSRSGLPGEPPLMPPGSLAEQVTQLQGAWATLVAYWHARATGQGTHVDVSTLEASMQSMDPAFGIAGTASGAVPATDLPPGRPDARHMYPVFKCVDGYVRICVLAKRQWHGMFSWLGEPEEFADPKFDQLRHRFGNAATLYPLIAALFAPKTREQIVNEGQELGVPTESVQTASEVLATPHFLERGAFVAVDGGPTGALVPHGYFELECRKVGIRDNPAPSTIAEVGDKWRQGDREPGVKPRASGARLFEGLRILDLGIIVVGAETARLFADLGADVIKVENRSFPDGSRQSSPVGMTASVAYGHRNKRSLGINLRSDEGREMFKSLVAQSDVVMSNFKPGTLESLGLGGDVLRDVNPAIILVESSALGRSGPWDGRKGYGPLVRAVCGLSQAWRFPDQPEGFCDNITSYPDHTSSRVGAIVTLACLLRRLEDGRGADISVAQSDVMFTQFSEQFLRESIEPGTFIARGNVGEFDAPYGLYPCAGDDQWCVVTVRDDDDWRRLCGVIGGDLASDTSLATSEGRVANRERIDAAVREWTSKVVPREAMERLQSAGVPAGMMNRVNDLLRDPHLLERGYFHTLIQPHVGDIPTEGGPAHFEPAIDVRLNAAPLHGEQTRSIARDLHGLDEATIEQLLERGVLEEFVAP
jgi:crotonobetainyl-CoA:carnitine CoA-transferase CaiB-like acyl-CoA transferase